MTVLTKQKKIFIRPYNFKIIVTTKDRFVNVFFQAC